MSTRLAKAEKLCAERKIHPTKHREIVITERNKEIAALKDKLKMVMQAQRESVMIARAMGRPDIGECIRIRCGIPESVFEERSAAEQEGK